MHIIIINTNNQLYMGGPLDAFPSGTLIQPQMGRNHFPCRVVVYYL